MEHCKIEGKWWIHGRDARPEFGIFSRDDDGRLSLVVKIPQSLSVDETALQFTNTHDDGSIPTVIVGRDADDKPVTLFGCYASRGSSTGMRTYNIHVLAAVHGIELESWSQECIHAVNLDIDFSTNGLEEKSSRPSRCRTDGLHCKFRIKATCW
jgi:hypothetical protein